MSNVLVRSERDVKESTSDTPSYLVMTADYNNKHSTIIIRFYSKTSLSSLDFEADVWKGTTFLFCPSVSDLVS